MINRNYNRSTQIYTLHQIIIKSLKLWLPFVFSFLFYKNNKSLHHFIILPIMYFPHQDWLRGGRGGGGGIFFWARGGDVKKILYDVGVMKIFAPLKYILCPPPLPLQYKCSLNSKLNSKSYDYM